MKDNNTLLITAVVLLLTGGLIALLTRDDPDTRLWKNSEKQIKRQLKRGWA